MSTQEDPSPVFRTGGISYLEIPSDGTDTAATFYAAVFGWATDIDRFEDGTGHVIGHFVAGRVAAEESGIRPYVYVLDVRQTLAKAREQGGRVVRPPYREGELLVATFRDPLGNVIGLWQRRSGEADGAREVQPR